MDELIEGRGSPPGPHMLFTRGWIMFRDLFRIDDLARHIGDDDDPIRCCGHRPAKSREVVA
jgi:hypothetical protein